MSNIVLYGVREELFTLYQEAARVFSVTLARIDDSDLERTVADVFAHPEDHHESCRKFSWSYMLYEGLQNDELKKIGERILSYHAGMHDITVKKTDINQGWTLEKVFQETAEEHEHFQRMQELMDLLKEADRIDRRKLDPKEDQEYREAVMEGFICLQKNDADKKEMEAAVYRLQNILSAEYRRRK